MSGSNAIQGGSEEEELRLLQAKRNPYARRLKKQAAIRLDVDSIDYFRDLAAESGIPYQTLINLYLRECASSGKKLSNSMASSLKMPRWSRNHHALPSRIHL